MATNTPNINDMRLADLRQLASDLKDAELSTDQAGDMALLAVEITQGAMLQLVKSMGTEIGKLEGA